MAKASTYIGRYVVLLILASAGCYYLYDLSVASGQMPECMLLIGAIMGFLPLAFGFNILGANGVKKAYARSAGEMDIKFSVALVTDVDDQQVFRPIKFIYCKKGFLFDNGAGTLFRVRYEKVRDWSCRNNLFSIQVKDKWVLREYDLKCQNEMQMKALSKYMNKYVPKEGHEEPAPEVREPKMQEPDEVAIEEPINEGFDVEGLMEKFEKILEQEIASMRRQD